MKPKERPLGTRAAFLLPSLKLKDTAESGSPVEQKVHNFLMDNFDGYTAATGNLFGYWKDDKGEPSYGEHRLFTVALVEEAKLDTLKQFLSETARQMKEECIYLETGGSVTLIYA